MASSEITLAGKTEYHERFPPRDAKKGYVARITGRAAGALKYQREFLGSEATILPGDEGLYEVQTGLKNGGFSRSYHVVLAHPDHGLIRSRDCEDVLPQIAKRLDDGASIADAIEATDLRPSQKITGLMIFTAVVRTASQAKQSATAHTIESAVEHCMQALSALPPKEAKKVLAALKARLSPPAPPAPEPAPQPSEGGAL